MHPCKLFDIRMTEVFFGITQGFLPLDAEEQEQLAAKAWGSESLNLPSLSVRSGFDSLLTALNLEEGSEIIVSAITIKDMGRILADHGLVPVPVDIDMVRLDLDLDGMAAAITSKTRAILVAHLFGSLMRMDDIIAFAKKHKLLVVEDCAQAFMGSIYRGHPGSDVCMLSFGPIKTATALGGAILTFRNESLFDSVRKVQGQWPRQKAWEFQKRAVKFAFILILTHPVIFGILNRVLQLLGIDHEKAVNGLARGFQGAGFFQKIRHRPALPLLSLLARRISTYSNEQIRARQRCGARVAGLLPVESVPGRDALQHTYWVFPYLSDRPEALMHYLWAQGFDATRGQSSMGLIEPVNGRREEVQKAQRGFEKLLYLPVYPELQQEELDRLIHHLHLFQSNQS